ncbi:NAD(P)-binding Rossmann-fold superfamily [Micractinium conductrix]|uniref:NAD(P)-binding Rossmann-fold superfamily n=1 Tax=Micractinium conductrix TaxID=554055 RepID=A0A2P6VDM0_9CHLO|nr:NAD(P)-binding Rossmann-fold superfamily [Micractinium conductrix]|eukprot:PSC72172.1 NAD(P)-binding Rossmann-fold superfamily [Micractinium conductrix]
MAALLSAAPSVAGPCSRQAAQVPSGAARLVQQRAAARTAFGADRGARRCARPTCAAAAEGAKLAGGGTPVPKNSILVVGATGTLGRQVVRRALDEGYEVRCIVRPRLSPADFLRDWGATTVQADLTDPSSLPAALVGVSTVIDCATARPEESTDKIDWEGKVALIQCAQAMGIQRYVMCSILHCDRHPEVPLMNIKACTEEFLKASGLNYTVFRISGFMQAIIGNYAVPILEEKPVWGTTDQTRTAYLDSQDVARMVMAALRSDAAVGRTLPLAGPKAWSTQEVIALCEKLADCDAEVRNVPVWLLKGTRNILRSFQWATDAADRLAFADVLSSNESFDAEMGETYKVLGVDPASITPLETYLKDYFTAILKKLKDVGASSKQTNFYI